MLVSGMNFVNNVKFSDFIIGKITEEQHQIDSLRREKSDLDPAKVATPSIASSYDYSGKADVDVTYDDCVTMGTHDGYVLAVDQSRLQVSMKKCLQVEPQCVFRKRELESQTSDQKMAVFQSVMEPSYYLATTEDRHLELQSFCSDTFRPDIRDERVFTLYHVNDNVLFIMPFKHKGYYLHHLDNALSIRPLDINFRPPEEFYMRLSEIPASSVQAMFPKPEVVTNRRLQKQDNVAMMEEIVPEVTSKVKRKGSKKVKGQQLSTPITPKPSFFGCFGVKSKKRDKNKR